jgi:hypothetical protein
MSIGNFRTRGMGPNPSVERTSNGGAHWLAPPKSVAPLAAAHLHR